MDPQIVLDGLESSATTEERDVESELIDAIFREDSSAAHRQLGFWYLSQKKYLRAQAEFAYLARWDPPDPEILLIWRAGI